MSNEKYIIMEYIKKIQKNNIKDIRYIAADFETMLIEDKHQVFGIAYKDNMNNMTQHYYIKENMKCNKEIILESNKLVYNFIKRLTIDNKKKYVYFHNLKGFDGIFIIRSIVNNIKDVENFKCIMRNGKIYRIKYRNVVFLDTLLILNDSLDNIAYKFLNKRKIKIDYEIMKNYKKIFENKDEIIVYLYRDVQILFEILEILIERFKKDFNIDITRNFTIPSISLNIYRRKYLNDNKILIVNNEQYKFIKDSYKGGYTNILKPNLINGYVYDVNSLYPYIMTKYKMPIGKAKFVYNNLDKWEEYFGFIKCKVYIPENSVIPPLYRDDNGTLVQGVGIIKGTYFISEIKNSLKYGCKILEVYKILEFESKEIIFEDYINTIYKKRIESKNKIDNHLYKLLMNSLYGRFGLSKDLSKTIIRNKEKDWLNEIIYTSNNIYEGKLTNLSINDYNIKKIKENIETLDYNESEKIEILKEIEEVEQGLSKMICSIQISASISAYSRMYLINTMKREIELGNEIYYYDTDSIHCKRKMEETMIDEKELGKYKLEGEIEESIYLSPKVYVIKLKSGKEIIRFKGLPEKERKGLDFKRYKRIYEKKEKVEIKYEKEIKIKMKELEVVRTETKYETSFKSKKYKKIYNELGIWERNEWIKYDD